MKVALGAVAGTLGGPATYAIHLARALGRCFPADELTVLTDRPDLFDRDCRTVEVPLRSPWRQPLWDQVGVARVLAGGNFDLYHGTKGVLPRFLAIPGVVTVHDLAHKVMPETFSLPQRLHLGLETPSTLSRARAVITDSKSSAADIESYFGGRAQAPVVIPLAAPERSVDYDAVRVEDLKARAGCEGKRVIGYLGTVQPRKNLDLLADAFVLASVGDPDWVLLVAGRLRPGYVPTFLDPHDSRVRYLGPLADEDVPVFLSALHCMVSPSSYEGFGLSFLEAMAVGCPVIGLANSSVPEVVGDAGILVSEPNAQSLAEAIQRVTGNRHFAAELGEKGRQRAAGFSWDATARATHAVYERVLGGDRP